MNPPDQVRAKGGMNRAVAFDPGHRAEGGGGDADAEMAFARAVVACVPGMAMAFVHHFQKAGGEGGMKPRPYLLGDWHFRNSTPSIRHRNL